jgi:hypothetical protein
LPAPNLKPRAERVDALELATAAPCRAAVVEAVLFHHDYRRLAPDDGPTGQ